MAPGAKKEQDTVPRLRARLPDCGRASTARPTLSRPAPFARILLVLFLAALTAACGGGGNANSQGVSTQDILARAGQRLDTVKSVHFVAAIDGAAYIDSARTVQLRSAEGDIVTPDQMQAKIKIAAGPANVDVSLIAVGPDKYQTNLFTGRWGPAQTGFDYSPTVLFDKERGLSSVVGKLREVERLPDEKVGDQGAYHLRGKVDRATIEPMTSGAIDGDPVTAELWIAKDSSNLSKLVLTEPPTPGKAKPTTWTLTLDRYDQPVTISRPQ